MAAKSLAKPKQHEHLRGHCRPSHTDVLKLVCKQRSAGQIEKTRGERDLHKCRVFSEGEQAMLPQEDIGGDHRNQ